MMAVALGIAAIPEDYFNEPSKRTVTLGDANRRIYLGVTNELGRHNSQKTSQPTQEELNLQMMNMYGDRSSLADMENALAGYQVNAKLDGPQDRRARLEEAYGDRSSLRHVRRAMEMYEVQ
jgi:hypothetical protein